MKRAPASRDLEVADILNYCGWGGFPVNTRLHVAIEAHRQAFKENKVLAVLAMRAVILAVTPDVQSYHDQLEYLTGLPLEAWEDRSHPPENMRAATLTMIEREMQQVRHLADQAVQS